jgi:glycosyltransferase involved in cell wall biosynthesis
METALTAPVLEKNLPGLKSVVLKGFGPDPGPPWWWQQIQLDAGLCDITVKHLTYRNKRSSKEIGALELPFFLLRMLPVYLGLRRRYDYIFTFECSLTSFAIAFWQTLFFSRAPKHVILQFIMREKTPSLSSRLKYSLMKWLFSSVHLAVCSARAECAYYREVFGWPASKVAYVPYHASAGMLARPGSDRGYLFAAGRTFRDFPTMIAAVAPTPYDTVIVASRSVAKVPAEAAHIRLHEDIPLAQFTELLEGARVVVVPLQDRRISTGQVVILHAMALGKPVIVTRTSGSTDYIEDGKNGLLVPPSDVEALRRAIELVMTDDALRLRLGEAARQTVLQKHLPHHYTQMVRLTLLERQRSQR